MAIIRESDEQAAKRWRDLDLLQEHYAEFDDFLIDVIEGFMGFNCTDIQLDIGKWVAHGPKYRMVQAQRGQAKTTITAAYAVWRLIHDPTTRVLIISAGSDMATEIANWIIQIINGMDVLECLRPDRSAGDRSSVTAFDVHYTLKGPEKSASITCIGITSNMQGKRADLLIADDIESAKNSQTAVQQQRIKHLTLDFISICSTGDIVWLGTPQNIDSVYNSLPGRGTSIRIWTGRYPTAKELPDYDGFLAPMLLERIKADPSLQTGGGPTGDRGKVTDPVLLDEATLTAKEIDQGASYFQLQHMLSTKLSDADRYPLKTASIRFTGFDLEERLAPMELGFIRSPDNEIKHELGIKDKFYRVAITGNYGKMTGWHMFVDPTGGGTNGDEVAIGITAMCGGRVLLGDVDGRQGGLTEENLDWLTAKALHFRPEFITIEKNYGNGALAAVWLPKLKKAFDAKNLHHPGIEEVWNQSQKELRIIDTLEPILGAGKFVVHEDLIRLDWERCQKYSMDARQQYSFFWQLSRITRERGALLHDDRLEAVAGSANYWVEALSIDEEKVIAAQKREQWKKMTTDPLGNGKLNPNNRFSTPNALSKVGLGSVNHLQRYNKFNRH